MAAVIEISLPDALVRALGTVPAELPRKTLEALAAQAYRSGKVTHAQVAEILGYDRFQTDAFLKTSDAHRLGK
jgi:hypothetical protein